MATHLGTVTKLQDKSALIEMQSACDDCDQGSCCTPITFGNNSSPESIEVSLAGTDSAPRVGDLVNVEVAPQAVLKSASVLFMLPVVLSVIGAAVAPLVIAVDRDLAAFFGVGAGIALWLIGLWFIGHRANSQPEFELKLSRPSGDATIGDVQYVKHGRLGGLTK